MDPEWLSCLDLGKGLPPEYLTVMITEENNKQQHPFFARWLARDTPFRVGDERWTQRSDKVFRSVEQTLRSRSMFSRPFGHKQFQVDPSVANLFYFGPCVQ